MPGENWNPYTEAGDEEEEARQAEAEARRHAEEEERRAEELKKIFEGAEGGILGFSPEGEGEDEEAGSEEEGGIFSGLGETPSEEDEADSGEQHEESLLDIDHGDDAETPDNGEEEPAEPEPEPEPAPETVEEEPAEVEDEPSVTEESPDTDMETVSAETDEPTAAEAIDSAGGSSEEEPAEPEPEPEPAPETVEEEPAEVETAPEAAEAEEDAEEAEPNAADENPEELEAEIPDVETGNEDQDELAEAVAEADAYADAEAAAETEDPGPEEDIDTLENNEPEPIPEEEPAEPEQNSEEEMRGRIPEHMPHKAEIPLDEDETEDYERAEADAEVLPEESEDEQEGDESETDSEAEEMLREEKNARERVLDEFRKQQEALNEAQGADKSEKPDAQPNKGPKEYMDEIAPAILVGSFVHDLSKKRDRKLGRKIEEANRDIEQLKSDTADAIEASARRAEERQTLQHAEGMEQSGNSEFQQDNATSEKPVNTDETLLDNRDERHEAAIREGEADDSAEITPVAASEAPGENQFNNQEASGYQGEYADDTAAEEISAENLTPGQETDTAKPEELAFDERQERISQRPFDENAGVSTHGQQTDGATPISDILSDTHAKTTAGHVNSDEENTDSPLVPPELSSVAKNYQSAIKAGVIAGLSIVVLIVAYLIFG